MMFCNANSLQLGYKAACLLVTAVMIVYWINKYLKDEDISVVEYKLVKDMESAFQPELTICFDTPIIEEKLNKIDAEVSSEMYLKYLKGELDPNAKYKNIKYGNVTIQLFEYVESINIRGSFTDGHKYKNCTNIHKCPFITFKNNLNAFAESTLFFKCFGLKPRESYVSGLDGIQMIFTPALRQLIAKKGAVYMGFNVPQQVLQDYMTGRYWDKLNKTGDTDWFKVEMVELLRRRNKPSQPCSAEWKEFDDWILKRHIRDIGCRAPYMKAYENFPICYTQAKIKQSIFNWPDAAHKYPAPCEGKSQIGYSSLRVEYQKDIGIDPSSLMINVQYARKIKIISQSRLIDGQALVGYIGGYVGLLLGTINIILFIIIIPRATKFIQN